MAIGRISGPMLYSNLERQGVDLAVEGNILYVNVTNRRIGANTTNPNAELQVVGTANLANISITGNTISSDLGVVNFGNPANITLSGGGADYVLVTDGSGNLRWDEISNLDQTWGNLLFSNNRISITNVNGNLELAANGSGFVVALNNFYAPNVIAGNINAVYFNGNIRTAEIVSSGNILSANVQATFYGNIFGNVTGTNSVFSSNVNAQYFNGNVRSTNVVSTGNISAPYFVGDLVGNIVGALQGDVFGNITGNNASFTGNVNSGWFNGNIAGGNSNFTTANAAAFYGNIFAQQVTSSAGDLHLSAATNNPNNIIRFDSVSAFDIPSGTTDQRPPTPDYGYVRYNTDLGTIEWWGGSTWVPGSNLIVSENITPDGVNAVYTLGQTTVENAILVNINGTIQQAGAGAYSVSGNQITFAEVPLVTDIIEIRYIAGGVAALSFNFNDISSNVSPSANVTYDLGSSNYRWRDLWLSDTINAGRLILANTAVNDALTIVGGATILNGNLNVIGNINALGGDSIYSARFLTTGVTPPSQVYTTTADWIHVSQAVNVNPNGAYTFEDGNNPSYFQGNTGYIRAVVQNSTSKQLWYGTDRGLIVGNGTNPAARLDVVGNARISGNARITSAEISTSATTGALIVDGGVGVAGNVVVGANLRQLGGTINSGYFYANVVADQNLFANTAFSTFICNASPHPGTIANLRFTLPSAAEDGREITLRIQGVPVTSLFVSNGAESIATGSTVYWIANNWATTGNVTAKFVYNSSITRWMRTL
jgi:energy-converting hydrogenase Eha subunit B